MSTERTRSGRVFEDGEVIGWIAEEGGIWAAWKLDGVTSGKVAFWSDDHESYEAALAALRSAS